tara:strand:- start:66840 stop:67106 length:267 start_codon:yes stop_codon:yes gene_type:complete
VIEHIDGDFILNDGAVAKDIQEQPDEQRDDRRHKASEENPPEQVYEIDALRFGNNKPVIKQYCNDETRQKYLRYQMTQGYVHVIAIHE